MRVFCAWCKPNKYMHGKPEYDKITGEELISHGICKLCKKKFEDDLKENPFMRHLQFVSKFQGTLYFKNKIYYMKQVYEDADGQCWVNVKGRYYRVVYIETGGFWPGKGKFKA